MFGPGATRAEHLAACKERAREYLDRGQWDQALASMLSDLQKHPETENHPGAKLAGALMWGDCLRDVDGMRRFIEGLTEGAPCCSQKLLTAA